MAARRLEPAPCPTMGCRLRWRSPLVWSELRLQHPGPPPTAPLACSFVTVGACGHTPQRSHQDSPGPDLIGGRSLRFRACIALLLYVSACAMSASSPREPAARDPRIANLQRAATLPWTDEGRCAVREASEPWPVLAERCFHALDHDRIEFHDTTGRCAVAGPAALGLGVWEPALKYLYSLEWG
jgi:hypothetical protein